jgi:DNA-binding NtrC family response regulator
MAQILIIDDDDHARAVLRQALERAGHSVLEAADGREGLRVYCVSPAEIVITDILMPEQNGLETIMALRKEFPDVKIIAITGGGKTGRMDFLYVAERLGALYTFHKPFELRELMDAVHELLRD